LPDNSIAKEKNIQEILSLKSMNIEDRTLPLPSPINGTPFGVSNAAMYSLSPELLKTNEM